LERVREIKDLLKSTAIFSAEFVTSKNGKEKALD